MTGLGASTRASTPEGQVLELALVAVETMYAKLTLNEQTKIRKHMLGRYEQAGFLLNDDGTVSEFTRMFAPPFMSEAFTEIDERAKHNKSSRESKKRSRDARFLDNTIYRTNRFHQDFIRQRKTEVDQEVNQYRAQLMAEFENEALAVENNLSMYRALAHIGAESPMESSFRNFLVFTGGEANLCDFSKETEEYFSRFE